MLLRNDKLRSLFAKAKAPNNDNKESLTPYSLWGELSRMNPFCTLWREYDKMILELF